MLKRPQAESPRPFREEHQDLDLAEKGESSSEDKQQGSCTDCCLIPINQGPLQNAKIIWKPEKALNTLSTHY